MATAATKIRLKQTPDPWSLRERLALACSVQRSGDQNWVSVSRAIKPFGEPNRPTEWFSQKSCALQYADLLEKVETPKRKRQDRGEVDTPGTQIVRKLTIERIEELKKLVQDGQDKYKRLKQEVELVKSGAFDDKIKDVWEDIQQQKPADEDSSGKSIEESPKSKIQVGKKPLTPIKRQTGGLKLKIGEPIADYDDSTQEAFPEAEIKVEDDSIESVPAAQPGSSGQQSEGKTPSSPPILSLLLQNSNNQPLVQQTDTTQNVPIEAVKEEVEIKSDSAPDGKMGDDMIVVCEGDIESQEVVSSTVKITAAPMATATISLTTSTVVKTETASPISTSAPTLSRLLVTPPISTSPAAKALATQSAALMQSSTILSADKKGQPQPDVPKTQTTPTTPKTDTSLEVQETLSESTPSTPTKSSMSAPAMDDEALSPASSIVSNETDAGSTKGSVSKSRSRSRGRRGRPSRTSGRLTRGRIPDDDSYKPSDSSDDDGLERESDADITAKLSMSMTESIPNSPASFCQRRRSSDTEEEKNYKAWKKSIMLVWRAASTHKFANVFLHPVTEDIAPGYSSVVNRPMDLTTIKKHVEAGTIRTTDHFQRDMMLMFTNALMYNNSDQDIYGMATEMYNDIMANIEQFVNAQLMVNAESKMLRTSRRSDIGAAGTTSDKEEDPKKRKSSAEPVETTVKKKR